jgi:hypothetical protein
MDSSATSKRKLIPFVPDIPYHIQIVFIFTFGFIWYTAFIDNYQAEMPTDPIEEYKINVSNI